MDCEAIHHSLENRTDDAMQYLSGRLMSVGGTSLMTTQSKAFRISKLHPAHQTVNTALTAVGQTLAQIATACGITQDDAERKLSVLIDEGLCTRTKGSRTTALYTVVA
jgi:hypothetical protein